MLASFYSKGAASRRIFEKMKVAHTPGNKFDLEAPPFDRYLNRCNVLFWDMTRFVLNGDGVDKALDFLQSELINDLKKEFSNVDAFNVRSLADMIRTVYEATGERFYIIIDEWGALFREAKNDISIQKKYIDFLRELFKEKRYTKVLERHHYQGSALVLKPTRTTTVIESKKQPLTAIFSFRFDSPEKLTAAESLPSTAVNHHVKRRQSNQKRCSSPPSKSTGFARLQGLMTILGCVSSSEGSGAIAASVPCLRRSSSMSPNSSARSGQLSTHTG